MSTQETPVITTNCPCVLLIVESVAITFIVANIATIAKSINFFIFLLSFNKFPLLYLVGFSGTATFVITSINSAILLVQLNSIPDGNLLENLHPALRQPLKNKIEL